MTEKNSSKDIKSLIEKVESSFGGSNRLAADGCIALYKIKKNGYFEHESFKEFCRKSRFSRREIERRICVGKFLMRHDCDHVAGYSLSHLKVIARMEKIGAVILQKSYLFTVKELVVISQNEDSFISLESKSKFHEKLYELTNLHGLEEDDLDEECEQRGSVTNKQPLVKSLAAKSISSKTMKKKKNDDENPKGTICENVGSKEDKDNVRDLLEEASKILDQVKDVATKETMSLGSQGLLSIIRKKIDELRGI